MNLFRTGLMRQHLKSNFPKIGKLLFFSSIETERKHLQEKNDTFNTQ